MESNIILIFDEQVNFLQVIHDKKALRNLVLNVILNAFSVGLKSY